MSLALAFSGTSIAENKKEEPVKWSVNEPQGKFLDANIDVTSGTWMNLDISPMVKPWYLIYWATFIPCPLTVEKQHL